MLFAKFSDFFANLGKVLPKIPYLAISNTYHHHVIHNITMYNNKIIMIIYLFTYVFN